MTGFLKVFVQGILAVVLSPVIALILAIYFCYCILVFVYIAIRSVVVFFTGGTPLGDLPEEVEAKRVLMQKEQAQQNVAQALASIVNSQHVQVFTQEQPTETQKSLEPLNTYSDESQNEDFYDSESLNSEEEND